MARCGKSIISTLQKSVFLNLRLNCVIRDEQHQKSLSSAIDKDECVKLELYLVEDEDMDDDVDIATDLLTRKLNCDWCSDLYKKTSSEDAYSIVIKTKKAPH